MVLKGWSCVRVSLYRLCVPNAYGGKAGSDVDASHIFPQGVLTALTLVGGGARDGRARAEARCKTGLPLCSVAITAPSRVRSNPKLLKQNPYGLGQAGSLPFKCVFFPLPAPRPLRQRRVVLKQGGPMWALTLCWPQIEIWCVACAVTHSSTQTQPQVQVHFILHSRSLCPQPLPSLPCGGISLQPRWDPHGFLACMGVLLSCGGTAAIRDQGCFWGAAWGRANSDLFNYTLAVNTQVILRGVFHIQLFFSVIKDVGVQTHFNLPVSLCIVVTWFGLRLKLAFKIAFLCAELWILMICPLPKTKWYVSSLYT